MASTYHSQRKRIMHHLDDVHLIRREILVPLTDQHVLCHSVVWTLVIKWIIRVLYYAISMLIGMGVPL